MNLQRFGAWLLKKQGKQFVFGCAVATNIVIGCCHILPNTFLLEKFKLVVHLYENGVTMPVPRPLLERFKKTVDLLEIKEKDKQQFQPFMVFGLDVFSAGTFFGTNGVAIGLPINYTYIDKDFVDKSNIKVLEHTVQWETDEGELLLKSLHVPDTAQMYVIAREIEMRQTPKYFIEVITSLMSFTCAYGAGSYLNERFNLYAKARSTRLMLYSVLGSVAVVSYLFIKDMSQLYYENKIDKYLKNKSPVFQEGGKEYYKYVLNRNIALRILMGKVGEKKFSPSGNENYLLRQKHLPLVQRKAFFEGTHGNLEMI
ncbi:hypothetical protein FQA39_LY04057 [Lamprigera yunnana]|nr:hypothetical protein FQA39_LY04057 [Lamprigera yunnana]